MSFEATLTLAVIGLALIAMAREWLEPPLALGGALALLLVGDVAPPKVLLSGFAEPAVAVVGLLLILGGALDHSTWVRSAGRRVLGAQSGAGAVARMSAAVATLSAFVSNTAVVATFMPVVRGWAQSRGVAPSRFMMALSFAAILGGTCTLVGTASNLVLDGLLREHTGRGLSMFELGLFAGPLALMGVLYLATVGWRWSPTLVDPVEAMRANRREYVARLMVKPGSTLVNQPVARLRHLARVYLASIERADGSALAAAPQVTLAEGDILVFVGDVARIAELAGDRDLEVVDPAAAKPLGRSVRRALSPSGASSSANSSAGAGEMVEAVVASGSPLVGQSFRDARFRGLYDAVVVAVHRGGEHLIGRIGDIVIHPGDTLLLLVGREFGVRVRQARDLHVVTPLDQVAGVTPAPRGRDFIPAAVMVAVIALAAAGLLTLLQATAGGVVVLGLTRQLRSDGLWNALNWPVLVTLAAALSLGAALTHQQVGGQLAAGLMSQHAPSVVLVVLSVLIVVAVLTEVVTNVAAAVLVFPIAVAVFSHAGLDARAATVTIALGAASSFATPIGYQTNMMVAGAAGYRFRDFLRVGLPLKVLYLAGAAAMILWYFEPSAGGSL